MPASLNISLPTLVLRSGVTLPIDGSGPAQQSAGREALAGAGGAKWLSGNPASLAIGATSTIVFDLGADWQSYGLLQVAVRGTQALASINAYGSDDGTTTATPLCATSGSALAMTLAAAGDAVAAALPSGRFIIVVLVNGAAAQGATATVRLTAHPA